MFDLLGSHCQYRMHSTIVPLHWVFFSVVVTLQFLPFLRNATIEHMYMCVCLQKYLMKAVTLTSEQGHTAIQYRVIVVVAVVVVCFFCCCSSFAVLYLNMF